MLDRDDVVKAYALLLGRTPENESIIEHHRQKQSLMELGAAIRASSEYRHAEAHDVVEPVRAAAPPPAGQALVTPLASYGFGAAANRPTLLSGWSRPEPKHCWTLDDVSELELAVPVGAGAGARLGITLLVLPFHRPQRVALSVGGAPVLAATVLRLTHLAAVLPPGLADGDTLRLRIEHPDWLRPSECSASTDSRSLAIQFRTLEIVALPPEPQTLSDREVMLGFESIGDNCEFGFVQRRCGAEPPGLLRFNSMALPELIQLLHAGFAGFPERRKVRIEVLVRPEGRRSHLIREDGVGLVGHAVVREDQLAQLEDESFLDQQHARLRMLTRLFRTQMEEDAAIFVYRRLPEPDLAEVVALWMAMRRVGPATLLWVVEARPGSPAGTVAVLREGLLKGVVERLAPYADAEDVHLPSWLAVCRRALLIKGLMHQPTGGGGVT